MADKFTGRENYTRFTYLFVRDCITKHQLIESRRRGLKKVPISLERFILLF